MHSWVLALRLVRLGRVFGFSFGGGKKNENQVNRQVTGFLGQAFLDFVSFFSIGGAYWEGLMI